MKTNLVSKDLLLKFTFSLFTLLVLLQSVSVSQGSIEEDSRDLAERIINGEVHLSTVSNQDLANAVRYGGSEIISVLNNINLGRAVNQDPTLIDDSALFEEIRLRAVEDIRFLNSHRRLKVEFFNKYNILDTGAEIASYSLDGLVKTSGSRATNFNLNDVSGARLNPDGSITLTNGVVYGSGSINIENDKFIFSGGTLDLNRLDTLSFNSPDHGFEYTVREGVLLLDGKAYHSDSRLNRGFEIHFSEGDATLRGRIVETDFVVTPDGGIVETTARFDGEVRLHNIGMPESTKYRTLSPDTSYTKYMGGRPSRTYRVDGFVELRQGIGSCVNSEISCIAQQDGASHVRAKNGVLIDIIKKNPTFQGLIVDPITDMSEVRLQDGAYVLFSDRGAYIDGDIGWLTTNIEAYFEDESGEIRQRINNKGIEHCIVGVDCSDDPFALEFDTEIESGVGFRYSHIPRIRGSYQNYIHSPIEFDENGILGVRSTYSDGRLVFTQPLYDSENILIGWRTEIEDMSGGAPTEVNEHYYELDPFGRPTALKLSDGSREVRVRQEYEVSFYMYSLPFSFISDRDQRLGGLLDSIELAESVYFGANRVQDENDNLIALNYGDASFELLDGGIRSVRFDEYDDDFIKIIDYGPEFMRGRVIHVDDSESLASLPSRINDDIYDDAIGNDFIQFSDGRRIKQFVGLGYDGEIVAELNTQSYYDDEGIYQQETLFAEGTRGDIDYIFSDGRLVIQQSLRDGATRRGGEVTFDHAVSPEDLWYLLDTLNTNIDSNILDREVYTNAVTGQRLSDRDEFYITTYYDDDTKVSRSLFDDSVTVQTPTDLIHQSATSIRYIDRQTGDEVVRSTDGSLISFAQGRNTFTVIDSDDNLEDSINLPVIDLDGNLERPETIRFVNQFGYIYEGIYDDGQIAVRAVHVDSPRQPNLKRIEIHDDGAHSVHLKDGVVETYNSEGLLYRDLPTGERQEFSQNRPNLLSAVSNNLDLSDDFTLEELPTIYENIKNSLEEAGIETNHRVASHVMDSLLYNTDPDSPELRTNYGYLYSRFNIPDIPVNNVLTDTNIRIEESENENIISINPND